MNPLSVKLKQEREKRNISLNEISASTKINIKILQAIEDWDEKNLPQKTFLRGFVRSYAHYLRLDTEEILSDLQKIIGTTTVVVPRNEDVKLEENPISAKKSGDSSGSSVQPNEQSSRRLIWAVGIIVLLGLILGVQQTIEKYQSEMQTKSDPTATLPIDTETPPTPTVAQATVAEPSPTVQLEVSVSPSITPNVSIAAVTATLTPILTTAPSPSVAAVTPAPTSVPVPSPTYTANPTQPDTVFTQEVIIEAREPVTIEYTIDTNSSQTINLSADQVRILKARKSITLNASNGGAINIIHNGRDRGVPGIIGTPSKLKYP
jgi:cytoskeleton protein RodZ